MNAITILPDISLSLQLAYLTALAVGCVVVWMIGRAARRA